MGKQENYRRKFVAKRYENAAAKDRERYSEGDISIIAEPCQNAEVLALRFQRVLAKEQEQWQSQ